MLLTSYNRIDSQSENTFCELDRNMVHVSMSEISTRFMNNKLII